MSDAQINSDSEILNRLKAADESALSVLYKEYSESLFISAYSMLKNKELCEDIIQDVFLNIWKKREKINIKTSLKAYLYTCVLYKVYDQYKSKNSLLKAELIENFNSKIQQSNPETKFIYTELVHQITAIVNTLPEKCQLVFKLSREKQLSHKEIAQELNISTKTVESHISNALRILRTKLGHTYSVKVIAFLYISLG